MDNNYFHNLDLFEKNERTKYTAERDLLYSQVEFKVNLFEECLNEVGLNKTFPFLNLSRLFIIGRILPKSFDIYPIDRTEELLMRNCVRRRIDSYKKMNDFFIPN
jgi:hypothetical protein